MECGLGGMERQWGVGGAQMKRGDVKDAEVTGTQRTDGEMENVRLGVKGCRGHKKWNTINGGWGVQ